MVSVHQMQCIETWCEPNDGTIRPVGCVVDTRWKKAAMDRQGGSNLMCLKVELGSSPVPAVLVPLNLVVGLHTEPVGNWPG